MIKSLHLLLVAIVCASCSPNVFVVDQNGTPIPFAQIRPQTRSFNWPVVETDEKGSAFVHQDLPTIEYLHVSKMGYRSPPPVNYRLPKPITVVLVR